MKIVGLKNSQLAFFKGMDPFEFLDRKDMAATVSIGAAKDGSYGDIPAGLLLGVKKGTDLVILWLFVAPKYRRQGYGEALLAEAFKYADTNGLNRVVAAFYNEYGRDSICRGEKEYFSGHLFTETENGSMVSEVSTYKDAVNSEPEISIEDEANALYRLFGTVDPEDYNDEEFEDYELDFSDVKLKDWVNIEVMLSDCTGLSVAKDNNARNVGAIGEISIMQFKRGVELCIKNHHTGRTEDLLHTPVDYFDTEVSAYAGSGDKVVGLFLLHYYQDRQTLEADLLFAAGINYTKNLVELMSYSIKAAARKYPGDTKIMLPNEEKLHRPLIDKVFSKKR